MKFGINTLDDFNFDGKTVICRIDINQPVDKDRGTLKSIARIKACIPTITELIEKKARIVLLAHQGSDIEYKNFYTTAPHAKILSELLGCEVRFIDDVTGPAARQTIASLKDGEVLLLDNVRFCSEEQTIFETNLRLSHEQQAKTQVVTKLAPLADIYVCDAFAAAHRNQPSLCGFEQVLPSAMGRLFEKEYSVLSQIMEHPERPCTFVLGGAKIADTFMMMKAILSSGAADLLLTGGLAANILLAAKGENIGNGSMNSILDSGYGEFIQTSQTVLQEYGDKILLPVDLSGVAADRRVTFKVGQVPAEFTALDVGEETSKRYAGHIMNSKTVFSNGPMGVFEKSETELGTKALWAALGKTKAYTVLGGGDSVAAAAKYNVTDKINYICTGGGALIRFLTGEELPVIKALRHAAKASIQLT